MPDQPNKFERTNITVYKTTYYDAFHLSPENRPIDKKNLQDLIEAIEKDNLLSEFPIKVDEHYNVIDGQHRLMAARFLNLPIYFTVSTVMKPQHASELVHKAWNMRDFLHRWVNAGKPDYIVLKNFWEPRQTWLQLSMAANLIGSGALGNTAFKESFSHGDFNAKHLAQGETIVAMALDFKEYVKFFNQRSFLAILKVLAKDPNYDHKRMMSKMKTWGNRMKRQGTTDQYYEVFNEIYNYKTTAAHRHYFHKSPAGRKSSE